DSRLSNLKAYRQGNLYNNNNRVNNSGGNDFYESGAVNPHLILKDMIYIFYPELIPYHELYYYKKF
ncbi:MAG: ABC transporter substrate-binding protein, partial [Bacteroidota bacterium]